MNLNIRISVGLLFFVFYLSSCETKKEVIYKTNLKLAALTEENIFDIETIKNVRFDAQEYSLDSIKKLGKEQFLKGLDLLKNKKQPDAAIAYIQKAILIYPETNYYFEYGNALLESKNTNNLKIANKSFDVAMRLGYEPSNVLYFKKAIINAKLSQIIQINEKEGVTNKEEEENSKWSSAFYFLKNSITSGFTDSLLIFENPDLKIITKNEKFIDFWNSNSASLKGKTESEKGKFGYFVKIFPKIEKAKFSIGLADVRMENFNNTISYEFAKFLPEMENVTFGRNVSDEFYTVGNIKENGKYIALIYFTRNFGGDIFSNTKTFLATYTKEGNEISKIMIACTCSPEKFKTVEIDQSNIVVSNHKLQWVKPLDEVWIGENKIKKSEIVSEEAFQISDAGEILDAKGQTVRNEKTENKLLGIKLF